VSDYLLLECAEPDVALPVTLLLEGVGFHVRVAVNEAQALALVNSAPPALALIDLGVRDVDELYWLAELKRRHNGQRPFPVILLSGREDLDEQAQRLFAEGWHPTPIDPAGLMALVRSTMQQAPDVIGA